jgi:hypothetical protein
MKTFYFNLLGNYPNQRKFAPDFSYPAEAADLWTKTEAGG